MLVITSIAIIVIVVSTIILVGGSQDSNNLLDTTISWQERWPCLCHMHSFLSFFLFIAVFSLKTNLHAKNWSRLSFVNIKDYVDKEDWGRVSKGH